MRRGDAAARAARALVGARFRLHGRDPATGLDCVGVAAAALGCPAPADYAMRTGDADRAAMALAAAGLGRVAHGAPGDVVLMRSGPGQLHLAVLTDSGMIHADASLRRVVERPGAPPWPVIGAWRGEKEG
ncbi:peptidoglycan endopeptidase [Sphingomonas sp. IW22]|uniref:peptidoglycan endopeptidase n=1 Tax=Sphingomonas sp. IW22 TaxID=3242489 RepID=UPI0035212D7E